MQEQFENFQPFNEQELIDKNFFLELLKTPNYLTRDNHFGHLTASGFVVNHAHDKMLMVYHNIFNGWIYPGGHADGDDNLLRVALREVKEETNLDVKVLDEMPFSIQALAIDGHVKHNHYVSSHIHFDVCYLFEASENAELKFRPDESAGAKWVPFDQAASDEVCDFIRPIHQKLIAKLKEQDAKK